MKWFVTELIASLSEKSKLILNYNFSFQIFGTFMYKKHNKISSYDNQRWILLS